MTVSPLHRPQIDPTPIFEHFRGSYGSELLTVATCHFDVFGRLGRQSMTLEELRGELQLEARPANVLVTALCAMGLITEKDGRLQLTDLSREHLVPDGQFDVGNYVGLAAESPGVLTMAKLLKSNRPLGSDEGDDAGTAFIYRDGSVSAMDARQSARHFTLALAGRARNVAPFLADALDASEVNTIVDVGGGTGIYSYALLQKNPHLRAKVFDRPEVLKVAEEMARDYGVLDRTELVGGDMFADALPSDGQCVLLSNILHDWDVPQCQTLVERCANVLPAGGRLVIHDVFLNDELDGPLPIALYSAALFSLTEGRAYSAAEYRDWLQSAGLVTQQVVPTLVHCGALIGVKP